MFFNDFLFEFVTPSAQKFLSKVARFFGKKYILSTKRKHSELSGHVRAIRSSYLPEALIMYIGENM